jgi:hypothetical protein
MDLTYPYYSFGTLYGTVRNYDNVGNDIGAKDISNGGIFLIVKSRFAQGGTRLIYKSVGSGIEITSGSDGFFVVTFQSKDLNQTPNEYAWGCFYSPIATVFVEGTTDVKWIGGGKFTISEGVKPL